MKRVECFLELCNANLPSKSKTSHRYKEGLCDETMLFWIGMAVMVGSS